MCLTHTRCNQKAFQNSFLPGNHIVFQFRKVTCLQYCEYYSNHFLIDKDKTQSFHMILWTLFFPLPGSHQTETSSLYASGDNYHHKSKICQVNNQTSSGQILIWPASSNPHLHLMRFTFFVSPPPIFVLFGFFVFKLSLICKQKDTNLHQYISKPESITLPQYDFFKQLFINIVLAEDKLFGELHVTVVSDNAYLTEVKTVYCTILNKP